MPLRMTAVNALVEAADKKKMQDKMSVDNVKVILLQMKCLAKDVMGYQTGKYSV